MLNEIKFYSIGDFGYPSPEIKRVSDAMNLYSEINGEPNFILGLGDNFYPCGVDSINDNQFQNSWENIFLKHRKLRVPWYISKFKSLFFILEFIFIVYFYYHSHLLTYLPTYFYLYSSNCELVLGNHLVTKFFLVVINLVCMDEYEQHGIDNLITITLK